jgi:hypothetical protein
VSPGAILVKWRMPHMHRSFGSDLQAHFRSACRAADCNVPEDGDIHVLSLVTRGFIRVY